MDTHSRSLACGLALAFTHRYKGGVSSRIDIDSIFTCLGNRKYLVGSIDFVDFSAVEFADVEIQTALVQLHLHGFVRDVRQSNAGFRPDSNETRA